MSELWTAERTVSLVWAAELIGGQFPELLPLTITLLGEGFDNTVYRVNGRYVFRFPRRSIAVELLRVECALLPHLARLQLPLQVSEPVFEGKPTAEYPWPFAGYRYVAGALPGRVTAEERIRSSRPLAAFLRRLHGFPVEQAKRLGVPNDRIGRLDLSIRLNQADSNMSKAIERGLWSDRHDWDELIAWLDERAKKSGNGSGDGIEGGVGNGGAFTEALVHGDLHIRNILVNEERIITGIVDWGDVHTGNPAADLALVYSYLPPEGRKLFFADYGEVDVQTRMLARFRAVHTTLFLLLYGNDRQDAALVEAAQDSLRLALNYP
ncbi:phosphotransferase [Paenibacillus piri]|uniref:DUF1679 domain-containing protein n=1 Tax=Paenibacillus piri TaxID=2547395 RepID=A0A4R5KHE3_9BACL|nr:phosphotransferase [Paenibacillus piri]TDF94472.1 DUF1679 domain-containing protein [Paenibacillus piri]